MIENVRDYLTADKLSFVTDLDLRPMFGGLCLFKDKRYFGAIVDGRLYLRTTPATVKRYQQNATLRSPHGYTFTSTFAVPAEVLADVAQLRDYVEEAIRETQP